MLGLDLVYEIPMFIIRLGLDLVHEIPMFRLESALMRPLFELERLDSSSYNSYLKRSSNRHENL